MKKYLKIVFLFLAITTLVGCGKQEGKVNLVDGQIDEQELNIAEEKETCLKVTKDAYKKYKDENIGPFSQAVCKRVGIFTTIYFEDSNNYVYLIRTYKDTSTDEEKLESYNKFNNSIMYDKGLCENEDGLSALDKSACLISKTVRNNYDEDLERVKNETADIDFYFFLFKESEFK